MVQRTLVDSSHGTLEKTSRGSRSIQTIRLLLNDTEGEILRYQVSLPLTLFGFSLSNLTSENDRNCQRLRPYVVDSGFYVHEAISAGKKILVECANALMLDFDFGTSPYVTSTSTIIGGVCIGLGIPPKKTIGVVKE